MDMCPKIFGTIFHVYAKEIKKFAVKYHKMYFWNVEKFLGISLITVNVTKRKTIK